MLADFVCYYIFSTFLFGWWLLGLPTFILLISLFTNLQPIMAGESPVYLSNTLLVLVLSRIVSIEIKDI